MSFATEMNRNPKLSPVSSLVPAGYKSNTKKPHNGKKKKNFKNAYKRKRKHKIIKKKKK